MTDRRWIGLRHDKIKTADLPQCHISASMAPSNLVRPGRSQSHKNRLGHAKPVSHGAMRDVRWRKAESAEFFFSCRKGGFHWRLPP
jgi:hypothetical protein